MQDHEREFLIAEYEQAWAMILNIDDRRLKFVEYYSAIFTAIVAVAATLVTWRETIDATIAGPLTVLLATGVLIGLTCLWMLRSERSANIRYRKKINLLREVFLAEGSTESITRYRDDHKDLGIITGIGSGQPVGSGSTLKGVYAFMAVEISVLAAAIPGLWLAVWLID